MTRADDAHRRAQAALGVGAARDVALLWPLLDGTPLGVVRWTLAMLAAVQRRRAVSSQVAADHYRHRRAAAVPDARPYAVVAAPPADPDPLARYFTAAGPGTLNRLAAAGLDHQVATRRAQTATAGVAQKAVLDGGRETTALNIKHDPAAVGWARVTRGSSSCWWCRMLCSRGPVYKSNRRAGGDGHQFHKACDCAIVPVFRGEDGWTPEARRDAELWEASGGDPDEFRRRVYAQNKEQLNEERRARYAEQHGQPASGGSGGAGGGQPRPPAAAGDAPKPRRMGGSAQFWGTEDGPGAVLDPDGLLSPEETAAARLIAREGRTVKARRLSDVDGVSNIDLDVDGVPVEVKTLDPPTTRRRATDSTVKNRTNDALRQRARHVFIDARVSELPEDQAERGMRRVLGASRGRLDSLRVVGPGYDLIWEREP